jgi:hypothetical protein
MSALRNIKHERFALLVACLVPHQQAAKEAGIDTVYPGNVARIARRKDVRRRIDELSADSEAVVREKRSRIEARLNAAAYGNIMEFAVIDEETGALVTIDWRKVKESDLPVTMEGFAFDRETGRLVKFERDNAMNAVAQLRDMLGFKAPTKVAPTNPGGDGPAVLEVRWRDSEAAAESA